MRKLAFLLSLSCLAPGLAVAQQRVGPVVDLETVESTPDDRRSAFGRVMDVMIATLVEQQHATASQPRARHASAASRGAATAKLPANKSSGPRSEPQIEISLGERFALPPADAVATQADGSPR